MKKLLSIFLAILMTFGSVAIGITAAPHTHAEESQQTYTEGNFVYEITIKSTYSYATITDYTDKESTDEIVIPDTLGGHPVWYIAAEAFKGCQCTAVSISASVRVIDPEAFAYDMPNMERFTVDAANTRIFSDDMGILYKKNSSTSSQKDIVAYPKNAPYTSVEIDKKTRIIGAFAFADAKNLKSIVFAGGSLGTYYTIDRYAFYNAKSLETVDIKRSLQSICDYAFEGCSSLTSVSLPKSMTGGGTIGWDCFKDTPFINNPENYDEDGVLYIGNLLIATLPEADKKYYAIKSGTEIVAGGAFCWDSLKEVYLPASVEDLYSNPFARCANLEKFTVDPTGKLSVNDYGVLSYYDRIVAYPNGIYRTCYVVGTEHSEIVSYAFYQSPIKNFYLPANLSYQGIYYLALGGDSVTDIYFEGVEEDWIDDILYDKKRYEKETTAEEVAEIHFEVYSEDEHNMSVGSDMQTTCSCGYTAKYTPSNGNYVENGFVYDVVDGNAIIKSYLYKNSTDALVIPETLGGCPVTEIDCEFTDCMFTSVHISSTVTKIREGAFAYALNNEAFTVAEGNEEFSATADGVLLGVTSYAVFAYPPNAHATEYKIPKPVCGIMPYAFCGTKNLKTVTMPSYKYAGQTLYTVGMIFDYAFLNSSVESVYIEGEEFYWMGNGVFKNSQLKEISFVSSTEIFGYEVFEGTPFLENADYDEDGVFYHQNYLVATEEGTGKTDYEIKDGTTVVAGGAFKWSSLESVNIPASVKCIGSSAFGEAASLKTITVDSSNEYFSVDDYGVLYNKDKTKLVVFPADLENICYAVPRGVTEIGDFAFGNVQILECVNIPSDVTAIGENAFGMGDFEHISEICFEGTKNDWKELRAYDSSLDWARYKNSTNKTFNTYTGDEHSTVHTVTDSTCEEVGYEYYTCSCEFQYVVTIPAKGHSAEKEYRVIYEPTCTSSGYSRLYCSRCNEQLNYKYPSALGHDKELIEYIEPTCTETGKNHYRCTRCELDFHEEVNPMLPHTFDKWEYESGNTFTGICAVCGESFKSVEVQISLDCSELTLYNQAEKTLTVTVTDNVTDNIVFTSSDSNIASVDADGTITAKAPGNAVITARINGTDITATCDLTVYANTYDTQWVVDGEIKVIIPVKAGSAITAPDDPVKDGYVFAGWSPAIPDEMPAMPLQFTAVFNKFSKSEDYDVSATFLPEAFSEEVSLNVTEITADREPGGVYMVEGEYYKQVGLYNIKALNAASAVVQPNEGYTVTIKMAIPDAYKNRTDFMVYHRFTGGGREQLSTENGTLRVENGYLIFVVSQFSEFEIFVPTASMKISHLPDKTSYSYGEDIDLTGIRLRYTKADGTTKSITDTSAMTVSGYDSTKTGKQTVTVRYGQYTDTFEVNVSYSLWQWIIRILFLGFLWY